MKYTKRMRCFFLGLLALPLFSCSHQPTIQEYPDTANAADEVRKFDSDLNLASANQVHVLSPNNFKKAHKELEASKSDLKDQKNAEDAKDTLHHVALGRAYLREAESFAGIAQSNMEDVVAARKRAIEAGADKSCPKEFEDADENLANVTADIEKNKLDSASEERANLQSQYMELEVKGIEHAQLGHAKNLLETAKDEGAEKYAPRTLALTEKQIKDAEAFIKADRTNKNEIQARAITAQRGAERLLKITRDSKDSKQTSPEELALKLEGEQNKTTQAQTQLQSVKGAAVGLANENRNLASAQALAQNLQEAQKQFSPDEAEVYQQENNLIIRLKGLQFPTSQAVLKDADFQLLRKVQNVIQDLGAEKVVVEGHTDSMGGKKANEKLSKERANAVKEYLTANTEAPRGALDIQAVGYGYQKPLATNKTAQGRAQNRRVDVIIQPDATQSM